nr:hypothetical protein GCM10020093_080070 [Planobispora longispora]
MTSNKSFKSRVRARMAKTGESYSAARRHLVPEVPGDEPAGRLADPSAPEEQTAAALAGSRRRLRRGAGLRPRRGSAGRRP